MSRCGLNGRRRLLFCRWRLFEARAKTPENNKAVMKAFYDTLRVREPGVPVIAAVNGHAIGAGLALALAADLRIVSETAQWD